MATYFVEAEPEHNRLIRYGYSKTEEPMLDSRDPVGRWNDEHALISTPDLHWVSLNGKAGYCWEYVEGKLKPATI